MNALFTIAKKNHLFRFGRRRRNKGVLWASLIGLGISAATYRFKKNRNPKMQHFMNNMRTRNNIIPNMNNIIAEFSQELIPTDDTHTKK